MNEIGLSNEEVVCEGRFAPAGINFSQKKIKNSFMQPKIGHKRSFFHFFGR